MNISEKLKEKIEKELGLEIEKGPYRIYGAKGAAHRWGIQTTNRNEYTSEDTMTECVNSKSLHILHDCTCNYISAT